MDVSGRRLFAKDQTNPILIRLVAVRFSNKAGDRNQKVIHKFLKIHYVLNIVLVNNLESLIGLIVTVSTYFESPRIFNSVPQLVHRISMLLLAWRHQLNSRIY